MESFGLVEGWKFGWHMRERGEKRQLVKGGKKVATGERKKLESLATQGEEKGLRSSRREAGVAGCVAKACVAGLLQ